MDIVRIFGNFGRDLWQLDERIVVAVENLFVRFDIERCRPANGALVVKQLEVQNGKDIDRVHLVIPVLAGFSLFLDELACVIADSLDEVFQAVLLDFDFEVPVFHVGTVQIQNGTSAFRTAGTIQGFSRDIEVFDRASKLGTQNVV